MTEKGTPGKNRDWGRRAFGPAGRRTIVAFAEALFSDENEAGIVPAPPSLTERVADEFDLLLGAGSIDLRRGFVLLAFLVVLGEFSRASRLSVARRLAYLYRLEHAKFALLATLFVAFKLPLTMIAFELEPELGSTGFDRATISTARRLPKLVVVDETRSTAASRAAAEDSV